jgi:DNA-binding LytR/AlgR family response regulator
MERLPAPMFLQVHRSFIVNVDQVEEIVRQSDKHAIKLKNETALIPVSRSCLQKLKETFRVDQ